MDPCCNILFRRRRHKNARIPKPTQGITIFRQSDEYLDNALTIANIYLESIYAGEYSISRRTRIRDNWHTSGTYCFIERNKIRLRPDREEKCNVAFEKGCRQITRHVRTVYCDAASANG